MEKINITGIIKSAEKRDYTKKDGTTGTARELVFLTDDYELLNFGYNMLDESFDIVRAKQNIHEPVTLSCTVRSDNYNRNRPLLVAETFELSK